MTDDFWLQTWRDGHIGFHQDHTSETLQKHWPAIQAEPGARVFVPLAGKSLDMMWLQGQGLRVRGVELSPIAISQFFSEGPMHPFLDYPYGVTRYSARGSREPGIELIQSNVFSVPAPLLADCMAFYDRAAVVALSPEQREAYAHDVYGHLPQGCTGLMIAFEYPQDEMSGPPFAVPEAEVRRLFEPAWKVQVLERRDVLAETPHFANRGLTALAQVAYHLQRVA